MSFTRLAYYQQLMSSQVNDALTNVAKQLASFRHATINRYLKTEKLWPRVLWEQARSLMEIYPEAYLIFDDTVPD